MTALEGCSARSVVREAREEGLFGAREAAMGRSRGLGAESGVQGHREASEVEHSSLEIVAGVKVCCPPTFPGQISIMFVHSGVSFSGLDSRVQIPRTSWCMVPSLEHGSNYKWGQGCVN